MVTKTAVTIDAAIPMISVTANPLTGPVPNWKRKSAVSTVDDVRVDDRVHRVLEPFIDRQPHRTAGDQLFANALEDQHVGIDRDADREHDAGDARQRQRRIDRRESRKREQYVEPQRTDGEHPGHAVVADHDEHDQDGADHAGR